jgi:imidazolonepropionase-like amidohydrolase
MRTVVAEAKLHGVKVAAHAHGAQGIIAASNAGVDSIEHGSLLTDEAIAVLKKNGTWLVPTLYQWFEPYDLPPAINEKKRIHQGAHRRQHAQGVRRPASRWHSAPMPVPDRMA